MSLILTDGQNYIGDFASIGGMVELQAFLKTVYAPHLSRLCSTGTSDKIAQLLYETKTYSTGGHAPHTVKKTLANLHQLLKRFNGNGTVVISQ